MKFASLALIAVVSVEANLMFDIKTQLKEFKNGHPEPIREMVHEFSEKHGDKIKNFIHKHHIKANKKAVDVQKVEQIVKGILIGALDAEGFTDIITCMGDAKTVLSEVESSIAYFRKGGVHNVLDGLKDLGHVLEGIQGDMKDCSGIKADWGKMIVMIKAFSNPTSFAYHVGKDLIVNGRPIFREINDAIKDYDNGKWEDFGKEIGEAAAKMLVGQEPRSQIGLY